MIERKMRWKRRTKIKRIKIVFKFKNKNDIFFSQSRESSYDYINIYYCEDIPFKSIL